jgi:hypothetical protein
MNRYEATITLTVSVEAGSESQVAELLDRFESKLLATRLPYAVDVTYLERGEEIDCMENEMAL